MEVDIKLDAGRILIIKVEPSLRVSGQFFVYYWLYIIPGSAICGFIILTNQRP